MELVESCRVQFLFALITYTLFEVSLNLKPMLAQFAELVQFAKLMQLVQLAHLAQFDKLFSSYS